ncbi:Transcription factor IIIB subunit [Nymphon striatum]|nr:Transcription factor IIIB subunit [Nymphon striatum]
MSCQEVCQHCGSSEIERDQTKGEDICTGCGCVLQENITVGEIEYEDSGRGGSYSSRGPFGMGRTSKQITLDRGHKKIIEVAQQIQLNKTCTDIAFNYYKMFVQKHFTRGRKMSHVVAACVYLACRDKSTPHMLLDISDVVQVNVYDLGKTYLRFLTALNIKLPGMDPTIYIIRFAHKLNLGDKTSAVINTATRLITRMRKDLISDGRRPSGLCGAALLVAARLHEISITIDDVIKVVKVGQTTLRNRLNEFGDTPSGQLTVDEFMNIDLEEAQDPPCVKAAKRNKKIKMLEEQKMDMVAKQVSKVHQMIEKALENHRSKLRGKYAQLSSALSGGSSDNENENVDEFLMEDTINTIESVVEIGNEETVEHTGTHISSSSPEHASTPERPSTPIFEIKGPAPTASSLGIKDSISECMIVKEHASKMSMVTELQLGNGITSAETTEDIEEDECEELEFADLDDQELDSYLMNKEEVSKKTKLWTQLNADYLEEQRIKEEALAREKESNKQDVKKKKKYKKRSNIQASTAGEAIEKMLQKKKMSNKINYEVLKNLNSESVELNQQEIVNPATPEKTPSTSQYINRLKRRVTFDESSTSIVPNKVCKVTESNTEVTATDSSKDSDQKSSYEDENNKVDKIIDELEEELDDEDEEELEEPDKSDPIEIDQYGLYGNNIEDEDDEYLD